MRMTIENICAEIGRDDICLYEKQGESVFRHVMLDMSEMFFKLSASAMIDNNKARYVHHNYQHNYKHRCISSAILAVYL